MRWKAFCIMTGIVLVVLGIARYPVPKPTPPVEPVRPEALVGPTFDPKSAYIDWRWIGLRRKGSSQCPAVHNWQQTPLIDLALHAGSRKISASDRALLRDSGLDRFCVYTAKTDPPKPFKAPSDLVAAVKDRMAVSMSAQPLDQLDQMVTPALVAQFISQTGAAQLGEQEPTVKLSFVDSEPTGPISFDHHDGSQHGYTVMHLARELVCPSAASCVAKIQSSRALNYDSLDPKISSPPDKGGYVGTISELAAAITNELIEWNPSASGNLKHLILNLSIGWDGEGLGDLDAQEPSVQAVYAALLTASQKNVLVIAAAGNRRGGSPDSTLPILPAAWDSRRPSGPQFVRDPKLIYAVGGVDWQGLPLPNTRTKGLPRRVAYGDHAVAMVNGQPTPIYTGTSVSAAVVSAIAAVIWHLQPGLKPEEVIGRIDGSGQLLQANADYGSNSPLQRISLCTAVRSACSPGTGTCPALVKLPNCPAWEQTPPVLGSLFPGDSAEPLTEYTKSTASFQPPCKSSIQLLTENTPPPPNPCPTDQFGSVANQSWAFPQPGDDPCPGCMLFPPPPRYSLMAKFLLQAKSTITQRDSLSYTLKFQIAQSWANLTNSKLISATLDIQRLDTISGIWNRMTYPISFDLKSGQLQTAGGLGDGESLLGCRAQLNFVIQKADGTQMSIQNPVIVDP